MLRYRIVLVREFFFNEFDRWGVGISVLFGENAIGGNPDMTGCIRRFAKKYIKSIEQ